MGLCVYHSRFLASALIHTKGGLAPPKAGTEPAGAGTEPAAAEGAGTKPATAERAGTEPATMTEAGFFSVLAFLQDPPVPSAQVLPFTHFFVFSASMRMVSGIFLIFLREQGFF